MKVLLDTHTFIWWDSDPGKLSAGVVSLLQSPSTQALVSVVSIWETLIKQHVGKLTLARPIDEIVVEQEADGLEFLPVTLDHVLALGSLPPAHKDPFDRLLVAQATKEGAVLLSVDPIFQQYPVQVQW
jgi:PIN domain nuclease of toxin-antitoxin system